MSTPPASGVLLKFTGILGTRSKAVVLLDCGATGNFVSETYARQLGLKQQQSPTRVCLADGRTSDSVGLLPAVNVRIGTYSEKMDLIVTQLQGYDIILGMAWLEKYNPRVDWRGKKLTLTDKQGRVHLLERAPTGVAVALYQPPTSHGLNLITSKQLERQHKEGNIEFACLVHVQTRADGSISLGEATGSIAPTTSPLSGTQTHVGSSGVDSSSLNFIRDPNIEFSSTVSDAGQDKSASVSPTDDRSAAISPTGQGVGHSSNDSNMQQASVRQHIHASNMREQLSAGPSSDDKSASASPADLRPTIAPHARGADKSSNDTKRWSARVRRHVCTSNMQEQVAESPSDLAEYDSRPLPDTRAPIAPSAVSPTDRTTSDACRTFRVVPKGHNDPTMVKYWHGTHMHVKSSGPTGLSGILRRPQLLNQLKEVSTAGAHRHRKRVTWSDVVRGKTKYPRENHLHSRVQVEAEPMGSNVDSPSAAILPADTKRGRDIDRDSYSRCIQCNTDQIGCAFRVRGSQVDNGGTDRLRNPTECATCAQVSSDHSNVIPPSHGCIQSCQRDFKGIPSVNRQKDGITQRTHPSAGPPSVPSEQCSNIANDVQSILLTQSESASAASTLGNSLDAVRARVIAGYSDVFEEQMSLPPSREVDHKIELLPGSVPPSRPIIRLSAKELEELKKQLEELIKVRLHSTKQVAVWSSHPFRQEKGWYDANVC